MLDLLCFLVLMTHTVRHSFVVAEVLINASCQIYQPETRTTAACWQMLVKPYPSHGTNKKQLGNWLAKDCERYLCLVCMAAERVLIIE